MSNSSATTPEVAPSVAPSTHPKMPELLTKLSSLETALLAGDPKMNLHLKEIHAYLTQFEELSHLLTEDQMAMILDGNQRKIGMILAEETKSKKGAGASNKVKGITADDL